MRCPSPTLAALLGGVFLISGCATFVTQAASDKAVGRYKPGGCHIETTSGTPCGATIPSASVSVITIATPGANGVASGEAAAAAASAASPDHGKAHSPDEPSKVPGAAHKVDAPEVTRDLTVFHRTMVVTVARDPLVFNPADRLEDVDVEIRPLNAVITAWDTAATLYSTLNVGSIALTSSQSVGANASLGTPAVAPVSASLAGSYSQGSSRAETFNANEQSETLTVSLSNNDSYQVASCVEQPSCPQANQLRIHRQGGVGVDLTGNVIVKLDITLPSVQSGAPPIEIRARKTFTVDGDYFDVTGQPANPSGLALRPHLVEMAHAAGSPAIVGTVDLVYTLRHVESGDDTLEERDDAVTERTVTTKTAPVVLIPASQMVPRLYSIRLPKNVQIAVLRRVETSPEPLCFASVDDANDLIVYIKQAKSLHPDQIGRDWLGVSDIGPHSEVYLRHLTLAEVDDLFAYGQCDG